MMKRRVHCRRSGPSRCPRTRAGTARRGERLSRQRYQRSVLEADGLDARQHILPIVAIDIGPQIGDGHLTRRDVDPVVVLRSEEHTSELKSLMRISYAVFCLEKKKYNHHKKLN